MGIDWIAWVTVPLKGFYELIFINNLQSAYQFVDWVHPGHQVLILLKIIPWSNGVIMFIFFICKASNRALIAEMVPTILKNPTEAKSAQTPP